MSSSGNGKGNAMRNALVCLVVGLVLVACGDKSGGSSSSCVAPSGLWSVSLQSSDPACGSQTLTDEDLTKVDASDGCEIAAQSFDTSACIWMQQAACDTYTGTLVLHLDASGSKITSGTATIENVDGSSCDYDVTGHK